MGSVILVSVPGINLAPTLNERWDDPRRAKHAYVSVTIVRGALFSSAPLRSRLCLAAHEVDKLELLDVHQSLIGQLELADD